MAGRLSRLVLNLRRNLPPGTALDRYLQRFAKVAGWLGAELDLLAALYGTDKFGEHDYTPVYEELMRASRRKPVRLLEVGVGGYEGALGGESLRMWESYFRHGHITGIDVFDKTALSRGRVQVFQCSQVDRPKLTSLAQEQGPFDFILDDGSHLNAHQIETFGILWPHVKDGGTYIVEDVQTSYWPAYGGGPLGTPGYELSCMQWFKQLVDSVNLPEFLAPAPGRLDAGISSIAFHHNLIVVKKDLAARYSNMQLDDPELRRTLMRADG
ncbi:MAG: class I SAM-dependent methyltransferase [Betaproteobacteria bacterium]|nr:class I SAM-dependent methyltransferase [Betaproteobacteria bacterium]